MPTFAANFKMGDVVYGLSQSRAPYVDSLGAKACKAKHPKLCKLGFGPDRHG